MGAAGEGSEIAAEYGDLRMCEEQEADGIEQHGHVGARVGVEGWSSLRMGEAGCFAEQG